MKALFFSDTHLRKGDQARMQLLLDFLLHRVTPGTDMLFVLGDVFEFFCGFRDYTYPWHKPVLDALSGIAGQGTKVYYIEGNHEVNLKNTGKAPGIVFTDSLVVDIEGHRTFIAHGDEFTSLRLRRLIKSTFVRTTLNRFGPAFAWHAGMAVHLLLSRKQKGADPRVKEVFRNYARMKFAEGYDAVVLGHSHISDFLEAKTGGRQCVYLNTGDFTEASSYGEYTSEAGFQLKFYRPASR